jgi:hypothetical protein
MPIIYMPTERLAMLIKKMRWKPVYLPLAPK